MIPLIFHPTEVLIVDDNDDLLEVLRENLSTEHYHIKIFSNELQALDYINGRQGSSSEKDSGKYYLSDQISKDYEHRLLDINIYDLHKEIYFEERFKKISTIVVDYSMSRMDGLEFCDKVEDGSIAKVLLTGQATTDIVIGAFNNGRIDQYIQKGRDDTIPTIIEIVKKLNIEYFQKVTDILVKSIEEDEQCKVLFNQDFTLFFADILKKYNVVEYYLLETPSTFLLIDQNGKMFGLFLQSYAHTKEIVEEVGYNFSNQLWHDKLKKQEAILCYHNARNPSFPEHREWEKYIKPASRISLGESNYYYSVVDSAVDVTESEIYFFKKDI